jgi:hypothetical protein
MVDRGTQRRTRRWIGQLAAAAGVVLIGAVAVQPLSVSADAPAVPSPSRATCQYAPTHRISQVREAGIREASGLVASQQFPGIYWTLNDSGNAPILFAFDQDGAPRGSFRVTGATNVDWEALQLGPDGDGGFALYIGDTGDNDQMRRNPVIYRVPEPEPAPAEGPVTAGETAPATAFRFVFPGRSHNSEAMLVHPKTGQIMMITREVSGLSLVYRLPMPLDPDNVVMADLMDVLDIRPLGPSGNSQVTDATISPDGQHIAVRTYSAVLIFDTHKASSPDRIWEQAPAVFPLADGPKGEGITYRLGSDDLLTIGEETPASLYATDMQC